MSKDLPKLALSVRQPWAWAILHAGKRLENRSQAAIDHGMTMGVICLHAAKGMTQEEYESGRDFIRAAADSALYPDLDVPKPCDLMRGGIIGTMHVVGVARSADDVDGNRWFVGPRALILSRVELVEPIAAVGALGYFQWTPGGAFDDAKPWMKAWPEKSERVARVKAAMPTVHSSLSLFPAETKEPT